MKKIYLLAAMALFTFTTNAQFTDNLDSYTEGPISPQDDKWRTWSGDNDNAAENGEITTEQAFSAPNSMKIGPGQGPQDQLLLFSNQPTTGAWDVEFKMYIPVGNSGYFNIQGEITTPQAGSFLSTDINFNAGGGSPGMGALGDTGITFAFPHDEWFTVIATADMDAQTYSMTINGTEAIPEGTAFNAAVPYLGGLDFFATDVFHTAYFDDIEFRVSTLGIENEDGTAISLYPNPAQKQLTVSTKSVVYELRVINILGKVILQERTNTVSPSLDVSTLARGTYILQVIAESGVESLKFLKN